MLTHTAEDLELLLDGKLACGFIMHEEEATWVGTAPCHADTGFCDMHREKLLHHVPGMVCRQCGEWAHKSSEFTWEKL
jgi:hypothetical protein